MNEIEIQERFKNSDFHYNDLEEICEFSKKTIEELERIDGMMIVTR
jgi:hypothetical protein